MRWHRAGFRHDWRWKSRSFGGRPQIDADLRALIRRMSVDNPLWGAPRIHGELLKLGFEVAQSSVAKYMVKRCGPPSQGWCTFLRHHAPDIAAMDLFVVPSIGLDLLYALVIVRLARRDLVWINVTTHPTADWITTSASSRISLRTCCQCRRNSRCLPIAAMYSHASRIVRSMPPSFVGRGGMSFLERYAGGRAARQDDSRVVILVIILLAIGASFVATGGLLAEAKDAPHRTLNLGLAAATIIVAAAGHPGGLHASLRTRILSSERWPAGLCRRARFSGRSKPGLLGVLLFRDLVWGSITDVRCVDLRRLATLHAIISFSFNTAVLALAINLAASMI